jgi:hypothetical protein
VTGCQVPACRQRQKLTVSVSRPVQDERQVPTIAVARGLKGAEGELALTPPSWGPRTYWAISANTPQPMYCRVYAA